MDTGIGLRQPHYAALLEAAPRLGFVEVHSENFFADGGAALQVLLAARERWPVSLHGVGLGLGSAAGIDDWHLERLARLVQRIDPVRVSDHASFARAPRRHGGAPVHAADLLPVAFTEASLAITAANVQRVQERLQRTILVENVSAYLQWADDRIAEPDWFNELARRTGCGVLLDVNNLVVNALNGGEGSDDAPYGPAARSPRGGAVRPGEPLPDPAAAATAAACRWVDRIDAARVGEIHLAGYDDRGEIVIDDHGSRVREPVWRVYAQAVRRLGAVPALVEWDTGVPPLPVLLAEAARAEAVRRDCAAEVAQA